ncbi:MAG: hypothetical protein QM500_12585 [Methylococcales bacterium]
MMKGKFITLEGGEGCGKSTNLIFIEQWLKDKGISVVTTREPRGTVFAENIRQLNVQGNIKLDLTLLLDTPVAIGMDRVSKRGELDRFELEKQAFFEQVRATYLFRTENNPETIKIINAAQSLEKVQQEIISVIRRIL